jgi:serine/threonine protein kinase
MEFIDGVDLEKLARRDGAMPLERVLVIGLQIARALEAAHQAGIIHRDLKPSNVMLVRGREEAELVKVLDFGVAKFLRGDTGGPEPVGPVPELTQHDAAVGTPRYMAPEQIGPGREIDFRADIYALGGVLYFMLTGGCAPIEGDTVERVWQRKLNEDPTPLRDHRADLPEELEVLVMRCLARDPAERPPSMTALKAALVASLEKVRAMDSALMPVKAPSETVVAGGRQWRMTLAAAGVVLLAGTAGAVIWRSHLDGTESRALSRELTPDLPPAAIINTPPRSPRSVESPPSSPPATPPLAPPTPPSTIRRAPAAAAVHPALPPPPETRLARRAAVVQRPVVPTDATQLIAAAESLFHRGDFVDAQIRAEKAVKLAPGPRTYLLLGNILLEDEQFEEAAAAFSRVLAFDAANAAARRGLEQAQHRKPAQ